MSWGQVAGPYVPPHGVGRRTPTMESRRAGAAHPWPACCCRWRAGTWRFQRTSATGHPTPGCLCPCPVPRPRLGLVRQSSAGRRPGRESLRVLCQGPASAGCAVRPKLLRAGPSRPRQCLAVQLVAAWVGPVEAMAALRAQAACAKAGQSESTPVAGSASVGQLQAAQSVPRRPVVASATLGLPSPAAALRGGQQQQAVQATTVPPNVQAQQPGKSARTEPVSPVLRSDQTMQRQSPRHVMPGLRLRTEPEKAVSHCQPTFLRKPGARVARASAWQTQRPHDPVES